MELTRETYFSVCKENGFWGAKDKPEVNQDNFYLPIDVAPCFLQQLQALAFSWYNDKCYSHFQRSSWNKITTVEDLQNEIERCKELYERKCKAAMKKMVAVKKKEIRESGRRYDL